MSEIVKISLLLILSIVLVFESCSNGTDKNYLSPPTEDDMIKKWMNEEKYLIKLEELNIVTSYEQGLEKSLKSNKPILLFFTGYGVVNSRKMEENLIFSNDEVFSLMKNKFVNIWLYVDDRKNLSTKTERESKTYGEKWLKLEKEKFGRDSQPLFVILTKHGKVIAGPLEYTLDDKKFITFLKQGL